METTDKEQYKQLMREKAAHLSCPFEDCEGYKKPGNGDIIFIRKYGQGETQNLFKCMKCRRTFSERRGTPLFECHLEEEKVYQILKCVGEGNSLRATARIVGVNKDTVGSIVKRFGNHMEKVTDHLMHDYHLEECQLDERWGFIKKKRRI